MSVNDKIKNSGLLTLFDFKSPALDPGLLFISCRLPRSLLVELQRKRMMTTAPMTYWINTQKMSILKNKMEGSMKIQRIAKMY